jgi:hypothetical protein
MSNAPYRAAQLAYLATLPARDAARKAYRAAADKAQAARDHRDALHPGQHTAKARNGWLTARQVAVDAERAERAALHVRKAAERVRYAALLTMQALGPARDGTPYGWAATDPELPDGDVSPVVAARYLYAWSPRVKAVHLRTPGPFRMLRAFCRCGAETGGPHGTELCADLDQLWALNTANRSRWTKRARAFHTALREAEAVFGVTSADVQPRV